MTEFCEVISSIDWAELSCRGRRSIATAVTPAFSKVSTYSLSVNEPSMPMTQVPGFMREMSASPGRSTKPRACASSRMVSASHTCAPAAM